MLGPRRSPDATRLDWRGIRAGGLASVVVGLALAACGGGAGRQAELGFSPSPGSPAASPQTQISIRGADPSQLREITVTGSRSGRHSGRLEAQPEGRGMSFLPTQPFTPGETVAVSLRHGSSKPIRFHFTVTHPATLTVQANLPGKPTEPGQVQSFRSAPELRPPTVSVAVSSSRTAPGEIFLGASNKLGHAGPMILDGHGHLIWFHPLAGKTQAFDVREQRFQGKPVLTWWQGIVSTRGYGVGEDLIYDDTYRRIATVRAAEGSRADLHEFVITPQGTALITAYNPVRADLSSVGGPRDGTVLDGVVQELDIKTGLVLFEWHSLGNVPLSDSYAKPAGDGLFDYFHVNSVALDTDGNLLVSARNTSAIYKVDRITGQIRWRLGGKRSDFAMGPGATFALQHDVRRQPDGTITVFDDGQAPGTSRAIVLRLDESAMTATLVREYRQPQNLLATSQGNVQVLPNGNVFVGWGSLPRFSEFAADGTLLYDAAYSSTQSYRDHRYAWVGRPVDRPALAVDAHAGALTVYASWNGATEVASWEVLAGSDGAALKPVAAVPRTGFETVITTTTAAPLVAVRARDATGAVLGTSPVTSTQG